MNTRLIKYLVIVVGLFSANSCKEDFVNVTPKGLLLEDNYYKNRDQAFSALVAAYDMLSGRGVNANPWPGKLGCLLSASDDHFAGGGNATDINEMQTWSNYTLTPEVGPSGLLWSIGFRGVFRTNVLLDKLPGVPMDDSEKARFMAEGKFLRAYYYFDLVMLFKNVPLFTTPIAPKDYSTKAQAPPQEVWAQVEKDLTEAIPDLPNTIVASGELGRITKGAAIALLGKVYLYQNKFTEAAAELAKVNGPTPGSPTPDFGYDLVADFGDLFSNQVKFNSESILEIVHTGSSNTWSPSDTDGNMYVQFAGPRDYNRLNVGAPDFASGWSFFTVTDRLVTAMTGDPRFEYTIADIKSEKDAGNADYTPGNMDTGYFTRKLLATVTEFNSNNPSPAKDRNYARNEYAIRLADTYLMEAEALVRGGGSTARAQALLDAVRARVGLTSISATEDNIFNERRLELAGEGHRWFDLVRTGRAATELGWKGFVAGKHEVLPIPANELINTNLKQNKEWGGPL